MAENINYTALRKALIEKWWAAKFAGDRQQQIALQHELARVIELIRAHEEGKRRTQAKGRAR